MEARRAAPKRLEYRLDVGDSKRGSHRSDPSKWAARAFRIAEDRLGGKTIDQIAQQVGLSRASVIDCLQQMGFQASEGFQRSRACLFNHGETLTGRAIAELSHDYGLTKRELANRLGVHHVWLSRITTGRHLGRPINVPFAKSVLQMRRTLARERRHQSPTSKGGRPYALPRSERDALPRKYEALHLDLKLLRRWALDHEGRAKMRELSEWLCLSARHGNISTLLFWPQFFRWIKERYTEKGFLGANWRPSDLTIDFLADDYDVSFEMVRRIVRAHDPRARAENSVKTPSAA